MERRKAMWWILGTFAVLIVIALITFWIYKISTSPEKPDPHVREVAPTEEEREELDKRSEELDKQVEETATDSEELDSSSKNADQRKKELDAKSNETDQILGNETDGSDHPDGAPNPGISDWIRRLGPGD